jgi:DNA adenine methylase
MQYKPINPCFPWFGGKYRLAPKLVEFIPKHGAYVEPFGGAASLLLAKPPSKIECFNDLDGGLVNFFRVLRDPKQFKEFRRLMDLTLYSRKQYYEFRNALDMGLEADPVAYACKWFVVARQSFGGMWCNSWSHTITSSSNYMASATSRYLSGINNLPKLVERIKRVLIENKDFEPLIERFDKEDVFFYCDPPYLPSTRGGGKYRFEMSEQDHERLLDLLLELKGKVMLSGYRNNLYERLEKEGWKRKDFKVKSSVSGNTIQQFEKPINKDRIDSIWLNYEASQN